MFMRCHRCRLAVFVLALAADTSFFVACTQHASVPPEDAAQAPGVSASGDARPNKAKQIVLRADQVKAADIQVAPAHHVPFKEPIVASARIAFDEMKVTHVLPPVGGQVSEVLVDLGQSVKAGDALISIRSGLIGQMISDDVQARADLAKTQRTFMRQQELYNAHATAQKDYDAAEDAFIRAQAEEKRTRQKAQMFGLKADATRDTYQVRAPISGSVLARAINKGSEVVGQYDNNGTANELFTIGKNDSIWVVAEIFGMDLARIGVGDTMHVTQHGPLPIDGSCKIDWVSEGLSPTTHMGEARCSLTNSKNVLKAQMLVSVKIDAGRGETLAIPRRSVFHLNGKAIGFVRLRNNSEDNDNVIFEQRELAVNEDAFGDWVPVVTGIKVDEDVVVRNGILLTEM